MKNDGPDQSRARSGTSTGGAQGHTNQQDKRTSNRRKTKERPKKVKCEGEMLKDKTRRMLTRPGRLRARSGSKLPAASVPLRALKDGEVRRSVIQ